MTRPRLAISILLAAFIVLSLAYSIANPLHEATDELRHYRFVQHIIQRRALPVQGESECSAQGHHPPLFYATAALATAWIDTGRDVCYEPPQNPFWAHRYWDVGVDNKNQYLHYEDEAFPWSGEALAAHLTRLVNILIGAGVVLVTYLIGLGIWPGRPSLAWGGAAIVAFNPMFLYMSGAVNNDVIAGLAGAAITLACVRLLRDQVGLHWRWGIILGALYGLALLSKFNLAAIIITIELAVTWVAWRKKQWREWLQVNMLIAILALLLAGWWFVRNQLLYGEPTGLERLTELWGVRNPADSLELAFLELPYVWTSLWGRFGYGQIPLPQIYYNLLGLLAAAALLGLAVPIVRREREELQEVGPYLLLLVVNVGLFFAVIFNYLLVSPAGPMGRFFFPALPSLALLMIYGLSRWISIWPGSEDQIRQRSMLLSGLVAAGLMILSLIALFGYLQPAYARPAGYDPDVLPNERADSFAGLIALRGYEIDQQTLSPGDGLELTLYWEVLAEPPGNYLEFVHLQDEHGLMITQRDTHPGLGRFPSSLWKPGDRFQETIRLDIPDVAYTPALGNLSIGFYAPDEGYRLPLTAADGTVTGDALQLATIPVESSSPTVIGNSRIPNPLQTNFDDELMLIGYEYDKRQVAPGESLGVTLYWQALAEGISDYRVQLRLIDESGEVKKTIEQRPLRDTASTATWIPGEIMVDHHDLPIKETRNPGTYRVQLALERIEDDKRSHILSEDGRWINDKLLLAPLRVAP